MRIRTWGIWAFALFLAAPVAFARSLVVVSTESGLVAGSGDGINVWKGIPYAQPPTGDLRWKAPQPPLAWKGILPAVAFGPICPQGNAAQLTPEMSEDCLNLNIWSGAKAGEKLPVFVWIHGGGYVGGSGRIHGEPLAHRGVVVVSLNYRLGVFGFLAHPDLTRESPHHASGNYALMDQIAALNWVKKNIEAFGGDPNRVTIGGASVGGTSIGYLLASPLAKGLFQGAMLVGSSRLFLPDPGLSETLNGLTPMEQVGVQIAPHIQDLRSRSTAEVMLRAEQVTDELYAKGGRGRIGLKAESRVHMPTEHEHPWYAFTDGYVMPDELPRMFASGRFSHVACMIGTCKDEGLEFTLQMPDLTLEGYQDYLREYYPAISKKMFAMYPGTTREEIRASIARIITDFVFLYGSLRVADYEAAAGEPVYVEHFVRVPPGAPGAMHLADVPYFLGEVKAGQKRYDTEDEGLSIDMMQCLAAFVKTLDPSLPEPSPQWPTWTPKHPQYLEIGDDIQSRSFRDQATMNLFRKQLGQ